MAEWHIELKDGSRYEVPANARVLDHGYAIVVEKTHGCSCGDLHSVELASWPRSGIAYASVTADGLSSVLVQRQECPEA